MLCTLNPLFQDCLSLSRHRARNNEGTAMFLKRVDGPRQVTLPDGSILTRADLPPPDTRRWVASRKAVVVRAVIYGLISMKEALDRYALSEEEFNLWCNAVRKHGADGLKVTAIQKYRQL